MRAAAEFRNDPAPHARPGRPWSRFLNLKRYEPCRISRSPPSALLRPPRALNFLEIRKSGDSTAAETMFFCKTGFRRPEWVAQIMARGARSLWGMPGGLGIAERSSRQGAVAP